MHRHDGLEGNAYPPENAYFADVGGEGKGASDGACSWDICLSLTSFDVYGDGNTIDSPRKLDDSTVS